MTTALTEPRIAPSRPAVGIVSSDLLDLWIHRHNQARIAFDNSELSPAWPADWLTRKAGPMPLDLLGDRDRIDRKHAQAVANLHAAQRGGNMRRQKKWWGVVWKYYRLQRIRGHAIWVRRYSWHNTASEPTRRTDP